MRPWYLFDETGERKEHCSSRCCDKGDPVHYRSTDHNLRRRCHSSCTGRRSHTFHRSGIIFHSFWCDFLFFLVILTPDCCFQVVASMDWPEVTKYRCLVSAQAHRQEIIKDLFIPPHGETQVGGMIRFTEKEQLI